MAATLLLVNTAVRENLALYSWLPAFIKTYVLGYGPSIFFIIASIFFIIQKKKDQKVVEAGKTTPILPVSGPVLSPTPILVKPKKFYSDRNKSELANALTDLAEILNKGGPEIIQKAQQIEKIWKDGKGNRLPDITSVIDKLNELGNLATILYQELFEDNGFILKYLVYSDELRPILLPPKTQIQPIINLQTCINYFRNALTPIGLAEKYNDKNLIYWIAINSESPFTNYMHSINGFKRWIDDTRNRIAAFRNSQLN